MARLDYANARLGARRAGLVGAADLRGLLARPSLPEQLAALRALPLGRSLPAELGADPLAEIEAALRDGWQREAAALLDDAEGYGARALLEAFLGLDDAGAVKAVLRAVARRLPVRAAAVPPAATVPPGALRAAAAAETLEAAVAALAVAGYPLAAPLRQALPVAPGGSLLLLEITADRAAVERARGACRRDEDGEVLREHVEDRVDVRNAETLLALAGAGTTADAFVPGGRRLSAAEFRRAAGRPQEAVRAVVGRLLASEAALATPWAADRAFERAVAASIRRAARRRPLSIAVPLAYLADRRAEVRRVSLLLRGAALGLPADELLDLAEA